MRRTPPERLAFYLTSRGITNEVYYAAQKAARFFGTNHVDNAARLCHAASTVAMKTTLGYGASTCSYTDWLDADLIVLFGSNVANNQPVTTKYLHEAKARGAQVAVVNPYREPGLTRYWIPSIASSAIAGTRIADHWIDVHTGGDLAFLVGALKAVDAFGGVDRAFVDAHTTGAEDALAQAAATAWDAIERESGVARTGVEAFARLLIDRPNAVFVWSMGLTQHAHGVDTVKALVNLGLARGLPVRNGSGLVPIRGHSGVQGGAEVGCVPAVSAETRARWAEVWGFDPPAQPGWTATEAIDRERRRRGRHVLDGRRQHARDAARHGRGRARAGAAAPAHPSGHRAVDVDAGRRRRRRADPAGDDPLRIAGRRHRDVDRAAHHLFAGDSGPAHRIREAGVVGVPRGDDACLSGARSSRRPRGRRGDPARNRSRRAALRRHRRAVAPG